MHALRSDSGQSATFLFGLVVTVLALLGAGLAESFAEQLVLRAVAGMSSAMVYISGAVLVSNLYPDRPEVSKSAIALYFGGAGVGIVMSGVGIPWLLATLGDAAWRSAWLAIGGISVVFATASIRASRRIMEPAAGATARPWSMSVFQGALASYFLFGLGYIAYMTFVIAWMVSRGASAVSVALTWGTLGVATMLAPIVWRVPRSQWSAAKMLAAMGVVISIGAAIPLYSTALPAMILSAFFFGTAMFSVPTSITDLIKTSLPKTAWGPAMAVFTVVFAIGQSIGPVLTGWIADAAHSLNASLAASVVILLGASVAAMYQRENTVAPASPTSPKVATR